MKYLLVIPLALVVASLDALREGAAEFEQSFRDIMEQA